ncbi:zinc finger protein [Forsythia ovata]|uniref:Zinc finger protein n=1 Tax=Forsythia ovata TaxID=205694 RepID=A0ABD1WAZ7_9LAMI
MAGIPVATGSIVLESKITRSYDEVILDKNTTQTLMKDSKIQTMQFLYWASLIISSFWDYLLTSFVSKLTSQNKLFYSTCKQETLLLSKRQKSLMKGLKSVLCASASEYEDNDNVGYLQCRHEYHVDCVKDWLFEKGLFCNRNTPETCETISNI